MKSIQLSAASRSEYGKKATKAVRREGAVPCVLYGGGETVAFSLNEKDLKQLIYTPNSFIVELSIDGKVEKAVLRDVQFHPIREQILHIDFYRVQAGKPVSIAIPVVLEGNAAGVKVGGKLALSVRKVVVCAMEENLPDEFKVDVPDLELGSTIFVGALRVENV